MTEFDEAWKQLKQTLHSDRWALGLYLGTVWVLVAAVAIWRAWL